MSAATLKKSSLSLIAILLIATTTQATDIIVYDATIHSLAGIANRGSRVLVNGKKSGPLSTPLISQDAYDVSKNFRITEEFFRRRFNLNSYDNEGAPIEAIVRIGRLSVGAFQWNFARLKHQAAWNENGWFNFGIGDANTIGNYPRALDVIAHEYVHAIDFANKDLKPVGQTGALKEHIADMFGKMVEVTNGGENDFLWGKTILGEKFKKQVSVGRSRPVLAARDLLFPERGMESQPPEMKQIPAKYGPGCYPRANNDLCGVHIISGVPNRAVSLIVLELGWEKVGNILFNVLTKRLNRDSDFADYAKQWRAECHSQLSVDDCKVVNDSFEAVGL